jgi:hypothetical protein
LPSLALIFALLLALSAQFMGHMLLVADPAPTTAEIGLYLLLSAGLIAFARIGLRWIGQRRWAAATTFAVALLFLPWWGMAVADVISYRRPLWIAVVRLAGLITTVTVAWMSLRKLRRALTWGSR